MKKLFTLLAAVTLSAMLFAQAPQSFSYQTVIRDASWTVLDNQSVGIKISILEDVSNGTVVYEETHSATTSQIGLVNLSVGDGTVLTGLFNSIDWGNHNYFIEVAVDVAGGLNYIVMGTTQLRSVPYALYAENSGSSTPGPQGIAGNDGIDGTNGVDGAQGPIGLTGAAGVDGNDGTTGPQGIQGAIGNTIWQQDSLNNISYNLGKVGIGTTASTHTLEVISPSINARTFKIRRNKNIPGYGVPIDFHLLNSLNQDVQYGMITASIKDSAAGAEIGFLSFQVADGSGSFGQGYQQERLRVENDRVTVKNVMNLEPLSTAPINASKGDMYMNGTTNKLMVYDGTIWQACW